MSDVYLPFHKKFGKGKNEMQFTGIDTPLRNGIHNIFYAKIFRTAELDSLALTRDGKLVKQLLLAVWLHVLHGKLSNNLVPKNVVAAVKFHIDRGSWDEVYFLIEYVIRYLQKFKISTKELTKLFNKEFESHNSAYRIVGNVIAPIIEPIQMDAVNEILIISSKEHYNGLNKHLSDALDFISHKPIPKSTSSIKQSIDAVEWVIRKITNENTFGDAVKKLRKLKLAPDKILDSISDLYDFTNSKEGIRHSQMVDESIVTIEEAKLYLVNCSAICSYLINICRKNGIEIK